MTDAYGYTRLSQQSKQSIADQKNAIRGCCEQNDLTLVDILDDGKYQSGYSTEERDEYRRLKSLIESDEVDAVVVRGTERLGRDWDERMMFIIMCRRNGVALHNTERGEVDIEDVRMASVEGFEAANDDAGMRKYIERANRAKAKKRARGDYDGDVPMGTRYTEDKKSLEANAEFDTVMAVLNAKDEGDTHRDVANEYGVSIGAVTKLLNRRRVYEHIDTHGTWRPADTDGAERDEEPVAGYD